MFGAIIGFSIRNKLIVTLGVIGLIAWGVTSLLQLPIDAVPDITNNQIQVITHTPSLAPQEVERLITMPVEQTMASIPGRLEMRSISRFGLSVVTLVFEDDVDVYWARAQVDQRLLEVKESIPSDAGMPLLAPVTTGLGEIFQYYLAVDPAYKDRYSLSELRTMQDWIIRRGLLGTKDVADVSSYGGSLRQVEIATDPTRLRSLNLSITDVFNAVERNNANAGGAYIERGPTAQFIRTEGVARSLQDIGLIEVTRLSNGVPVLIRDVATVKDGRAIRYGALTHNNTGEVVGGIVFMLKGANSSDVINTVKKRMASLEKGLPPGVRIQPFLDRTKLVNKAISTVTTNLLEGALIVIFVLVIILGNMRAGLIVASVIPLSMLFAIGMMRTFGVSGNLMSLGAIDFGLIVDGAVIVVEHVMHVLHRPRARAEDIGTAATQIRRSAAFGEVIIMIVYLPILALVGIEGKMFKPMAQTVIFAIIGAFLLSTTYVPMMASLLLKPGMKSWSLADRIMAFLHTRYQPIRRLAIRRAGITVGSTLMLFAVAIIVFLNMGGEFLPQLDEGDFAVEMRLQTGTSLTQTVETAQQAAAILTKQFPEVIRVIGKVGTSEIPLDPMPMEAVDLMILLKDKKEWTTASRREELADKMQAALSAIPGVSFGFQQPIQMRFNELMTGARQDVVIKIFGEDLDSLANIAHRIGDLASTTSGAQDVFVEPISGLPQVNIRIDRDACARLGVSVEDVNRTVRTSFAGETAGRLFEGERYFDIVIRLDQRQRNELADVETLLVPSIDGTLVPLAQVARVDVMVGPNQLQRENGLRRISVGFNVRGRDVEGVVTDLQQHVFPKAHIPRGYDIHVGGQFENLNAAKERLTIAVPVALLLILLLLYLTFKDLGLSLLIFTAVPLSAVGGVAALSVRGMPFSISAGVGFIALFGVAVLNGIVLISAFTSLRQQGFTNVVSIVCRGTTQRLRPVAMTALVASLGFLPMAISSSDGAEVQRPLATVVIGGLVTSTMLTLVLLPTLYMLTDRWSAKLAALAAARAAALIGLFVLSGVALVAQPVTLDSAKSMARRSSLDLYRARAAAADADAARGAAIDLGRTNVVYMGGQYNTDAYDNSLTLSQVMPFPTAMISARSLADARADEAAVVTRLTEQQVLAQVERTYVRICALREKDRLFGEQAAWAERAVKIARALEESGERPPMDRVTAEAQLVDLNVRRLDAQAGIRAAEVELQLLCGEDTPITAADSVIPRSVIPQDTVANSPLVLLRRSQVDVAERAVDAARSQYWPDISLGYFNQTLIGVTADPTQRYQGFTVGLQVPLWFMPVSARTEQAQIQRDQSRTALAFEERATRLRRDQLLAEINAARRVVDYYERIGLEEVNLLVNRSDQAFQEGAIGWIEHQSALMRHLMTRVTDVDARQRLHDRITEYHLLLGTKQ